MERVGAMERQDRQLDAVAPGSPASTDGDQTKSSARTRARQPSTYRNLPTTYRDASGNLRRFDEAVGIFGERGYVSVDLVAEANKAWAVGCFVVLAGLLIAGYLFTVSQAMGWVAVVMIPVVLRYLWVRWTANG